MSQALAGFWMGLWNGITVHFAFTISLFNHDVLVYQPHNTGVGYNAGFILGISLLTIAYKYGTRRRFDFV